MPTQRKGLVMVVLQADLSLASSVGREDGEAFLELGNPLGRWAPM